MRASLSGKLAEVAVDPDSQRHDAILNGNADFVRLEIGLPFQLIQHIPLDLSIVYAESIAIPSMLRGNFGYVPFVFGMVFMVGISPFLVRSVWTRAAPPKLLPYKPVYRKDEQDDLAVGGGD